MLSFTGWAVCGHDGSAAEPEEQQEGPALKRSSSSSSEHVGRQQQEGLDVLSNGEALSIGSGGHSSRQQQGKKRQQEQQQVLSRDGEASGRGLGNSSSSREQEGVGGGEGDWHPADDMPREQRRALGLKCKQLIDAGRLAWLTRTLQEPLAEGATAACTGKEGPYTAASTAPAVKANQNGVQRWHVRQFAYIQPSVSGENGLLLVSR